MDSNELTVSDGKVSRDSPWVTYLRELTKGREKRWAQEFSGISPRQLALMHDTEAGRLAEHEAIVVGSMGAGEIYVDIARQMLQQSTVGAAKALIRASDEDIGHARMRAIEGKLDRGGLAPPRNMPTINMPLQVNVYNAASGGYSGAVRRSRLGAGKPTTPPEPT